MRSRAVRRKLTRLEAEAAARLDRRTADLKLMRQFVSGHGLPGETMPEDELRRVYSRVALKHLKWVNMDIAVGGRVRRLRSIIRVLKRDRTNRRRLGKAARAKAARSRRLVGSDA